MPRQHLTPGKDLVPIVQEAGWASGPVWTGAENLAPPEVDPRTIQPVGSRYTDYATRPTICYVCFQIFDLFHPLKETIINVYTLEFVQIGTLYKN